MKTSAMLTLLLISVAALAGAGLRAQPQPAAPRFAYVDLHIAPRGGPLAAYQIDIRAAAGNVRIVGVEGGEHAAFTAPPYYDPLAMQQERVIIADFSTNAADSLPAGDTRVARIHVMVDGDAPPVFEATLVACATVGGAPLDASVEVKQGD